MLKTIVVSAVNLRKGGTLTILRQCLEALSTMTQAGKCRVVALVHRRELAEYPGIEYIELPWAIEGWGKRLWCEYVTMGKISEQIGDIDLWLSLHDTTPRVKARRQAVYCQTSFPFMKWRWRDFLFDPKIPLFAMFTRFAYRIGIHRNRYLIVQQNWLRDGFAKMFSLPLERFIVAPPSRDTTIPSYTSIPHDGLYTFFYASTPDAHKNFETLCEATRLLEDAVGVRKFRTIITVRGDENRYAQYLHRHWSHVHSLEFAGLMDKPTLYAHYDRADCLVFPSRIETWGLPISEYMQVKQRQGMMLLSDLPYAHETSAGAAHLAFFDNDDPSALAQKMAETLDNDLAYTLEGSVGIEPSLERPGISWQELFDRLLS